MPNEDTRTLEAIAKIKEILREYDLFGICSVISPERAHWLYYVETSWSALTIDSATGKTRIRALRHDFKTLEGQKRVVELTAHAIFSSRDLSELQLASLQGLVDILDTHFDIEHKPYQDVRLFPAD